MAIPEKDVQLLTKIGLTQSQAHLYLALLKKGKTNAASLSRQTGTLRTETYRILNELHEIGLVDKQLRIPYIYQAISLKEGTQALLTQKFEEYKQIRKKINELHVKGEEPPYETESRISISKGKQRRLQVLKSAIKNVKLSIDVISTEKRWCRTVFYFYDDLKECLDKGVKHRVILEETGCQNEFSDSVKDLLKKPNVEMRRLNEPAKTNYAIFDNKKVVFNYSSSEALREVTTLYTNHPSLLLVFREHFETLWQTKVTAST